MVLGQRSFRQLAFLFKLKLPKPCQFREWPFCGQLVPVLPNGLRARDSDGQGAPHLRPHTSDDDSSRPSRTRMGFRCSRQSPRQNRGSRTRERGDTCDDYACCGQFNGLCANLTLPCRSLCATYDVHGKDRCDILTRIRIPRVLHLLSSASNHGTGRNSTLLRKLVPHGHRGGLHSQHRRNSTILERHGGLAAHVPHRDSSHGGGEHP